MRGRNSPYNRAVGLGLHGPVAEAEFERDGVVFRELRRCAPHVSLCPLADPSAARACWAERATRIDMFMHSWVRPIEPERGLPPAARHHRLPHRLRRGDAVGASGVQGRAGQRRRRAGAQLGDHRRLPVHGAHDLLSGLDRRRGGGGAATLSIHDGLAELFGASTRPTFRNRGVQTALLASRLAEAQRQGCDLAMVHTEPGSASQRNVERLGFRLAYTKVHLVKADMSTDSDRRFRFDGLNRASEEVAETAGGAAGDATRWAWSSAARCPRGWRSSSTATCRLEDLAVGRYVVARGRSRRFFCMVTDVALDSDQPADRQAAARLRRPLSSPRSTGARPPSAPCTSARC